MIFIDFECTSSCEIFWTWILHQQHAVTELFTSLAFSESWPQYHQKFRVASQPKKIEWAWGAKWQGWPMVDIWLWQLSRPMGFINSRWWQWFFVLVVVVGGWLLGNNQPTRVYLQIENMKLYMEMSIGEVFLDIPYIASRMTLYEFIEI